MKMFILGLIAGIAAGLLVGAALTKVKSVYGDVSARSGVIAPNRIALSRSAEDIRLRRRDRAAAETEMLLDA